MLADSKEPGQKIGDYTIIKEIGRGGMGVVYLAQHEYLKKRFALKVLPEEFSASPEFVAIFKQEAQTLGTLKHPNIVEVHNFGEENNSYFLVMDYIDGQTIEDFLAASGGKMTPEEVQATLLSVMSALVHAHNKGIIHRDLKPENFLVDSDGTVKITDFGLAQLVAPESSETPEEDSSKNTKNTFMHLAEDQAQAGQYTGGTEGYMAPEVEAGGMGDKRADYYAIGVIAHYLITGKEPGKHVKMLSKTIKGLDPKWDKIIEKCLEHNPNDRYQDALDLLVDLQGINSKENNFLKWSIASAGLVALAAFSYFLIGESPEPENLNPEQKQNVQKTENNKKDFKAPNPKEIPKNSVKAKPQNQKAKKPEKISEKKLTTQNQKVSLPDPPPATPAKQNFTPKEKPVKAPLPIKKPVSPYQEVEPQLMYIDSLSKSNFGDHTLGSLESYKFINQDNWETRYIGGKNILRIKKPDKELTGPRPGTFAIYDADEFKNFSFKMEFKSNEPNTTALDDADVVFIFGYKNQWNFTVLELNSYGYKGEIRTSIYRIQSGKKSDLQFNADMRAIKDEEWHVLHFERIAEQVEVSIDNEKLFSVSSTVFDSTGKIGFGSNDDRASFTNPRIEKINTAQLALTINDSDGNELSPKFYKLWVNNKRNKPLTGTNTYILPANVMIVGSIEAVGYKRKTIIRTANPIPANASTSLEIAFDEDDKLDSSPLKAINSNPTVGFKTVSIRTNPYLNKNLIEPLKLSLLEDLSVPKFKSTSYVKIKDSLYQLEEDEVSILELKDTQLISKGNLEKRGYLVNPLIKSSLIFITSSQTNEDNIKYEMITELFESKTAGDSSNFPSQIFKLSFSPKENASSNIAKSPKELFTLLNANKNSVGFFESGQVKDLSRVKVLKVDGINYTEPKYAYADKVYLIAKEPSENTQLLIDYLLSNEGLKKMTDIGFTPVKKP